MRVQSLRTRLIFIILTPLLIVSLVAAYWQFRNATIRAEDIFDRGLLSAALAISRDVTISDGDALSPTTGRLIRDTSGGEVFYHVFAPDGVFVTGYSTPPAAPTGVQPNQTDPLYYDGVYRGQNVRVLRFRDGATIDGITGLFTVTVWQDMRVRNGFVREVVTRAFTVIALLLCSVALIVWFGVGLGLRPLLDLQSAIARRTASDLEPIKRNVPIETQGIVETLNDLLGRVSRRISSKDEFISNAAHQLRNPIAGVLALAEAVETAPTAQAAKSRSGELVKAARNATHLTNQLLSFERAKGSDIDLTGEELDVTTLIHDVIERVKQQNLTLQTEMTFTSPTTPVLIHGDRVMLREALLNLLTNAIVHGGPDLTRIEIELVQTSNGLLLSVQDNGIGIAEADRVAAMGRFSQPNAGQGSGLGLPIAARTVENHGGTLTIEPSTQGARLEIFLPTLLG